MKCPKCQFDNADDARCCNDCGDSLERACSQCGKVNKVGSNFCNSCGCKLEESPLPSDEKSPLLPSEYARKYVTVLFSDMSGYTAMMEKLDPEDVQEIMGRIFGEIAQVVVRYEGFIEKFVGDAVMALFGVPKAHEDDPVRAIKAAREIHEAIRGISPSLEKRIGRPVTMHTGINTGLVVTGEINLEKGTHGVFGDTVNTAARLLGLAKPDEILVGPETWHQVEGYFTFESLDAVTVKGKTERIRPYKVLSPRDAPTKTHRLSGLRAQLIGRRVEMARLQEALEKLTQGEGSIVSISGDAGTGKSRLIEEFKSSLNLKEIQWREGHAYAYSQNIPYFPLMDLLSRAWQIEEGDSADRVKKKVESGIRHLLGNDDGAIPYIGTLYSLSYPEIEGISPELWKSRLHNSVHSILSALTRRAPTVICLEDLHWADSSSTELLRSLLSDFQLPAVFLCAYRPPFNLFTSHQMTRLKVYSEIKIEDLSAAEAQTMVASLLKTEAIPPALRKFIQTKVEGNPFYLEEAINSLIESETLIRDGGDWKLAKDVSDAIIPSTVQGVIASRVDRLEREAKRILQEASVIGRAFLYEILKRISDLKGTLDKSLNGLERLDFIRTGTLQPELEYIFKHALTQEIVYNGLLKKERQELHGRIGVVMEMLFSDRLPEFYETLAYHYKQSQSLPQAVDYLIKAGEKSFKRYALDESHLYFKEAYDLLVNKPKRTEEEERLLIDLINKWGYTHQFRTDFIGFTNLFKAHEALAESCARQEQLVMFYGWFGFALSMRDMPVDGYRYLRKALQIAEEIEDIKGVGHNCMWLTQVCADMGRLDEAVIYGKKAREAANRFESDQYLFVMALVYSAYVYWMRGDVKKTAEYGQALLDYGRKHSNLRSMSFHYMAMGKSRMAAGDLPSAIEFYKKCIQILPDPLFAYTARTMLGRLYLATGQLEEAESLINEVIEHSDWFGYEWVGAFSQAVKGMALIARGNLKQGMGLCENIIRAWLEKKSLYRYLSVNFAMGMVYSKISQGDGGKKDLPFLIRNIGFLLTTLPFAHKKAEEHLNIAIKTASEIGANSILGQAYLEMSRLHKARGKMGKARECLTHSIKTFETCEADVFLKQARDALAALN